MIRCRNLSIAAAFIVVNLLNIVGAQQVAGTWINVTPPGMKLSGDFTNGPLAVGVDAVRPTDIYVHVQYDGTWKSTDYGVTWHKVSTGAHASEMNSGRPWYAVIDRNPNRNPNTAPTMYLTQGYGACSIWKSANGGVDWDNVWNNNIYAPDGVTNISSDVGSDISAVIMPDSTNPNHIIASLHGYYGTGNNNGIFETTDGGSTWIVHKGATFNFQPHSDVLFAYDDSTWMVTHGTSWPNVDVYRSTNSADSWEVVTTLNQGVGRCYVIAGSTIYSGTDFAGGVWKSPDKGVSWTKLSAPGNQFSWVCATATKVYASTNADPGPHICYADLNNDNVWTDAGNPSGMNGNGALTPGVTFDGSNYIIIAAQASAGLWRYVEPATTTVTRKPIVVSKTSTFRSASRAIRIESGTCRVVDKTGAFYNVNGKMIGPKGRAAR